MNQKIKEILEKHIDIDQLLPDFYHEDLNNAIIEICEEQKEECAYIFNQKSVLHQLLKTEIINSKNIAHE